MMNKVFTSSHAFWNWLVVSSADPTSVALTVKGFVSLGAVQAVFSVLPLIGFHPTFDLNSLGDSLYTVVYGTLSAVAGIVTAYGAIRKVCLFFAATPA